MNITIKAVNELNLLVNHLSRLYIERKKDTKFKESSFLSLSTINSYIYSKDGSKNENVIFQLKADEKCQELILSLANEIIKANKTDLKCLPEDLFQYIEYIVFEHANNNYEDFINCKLIKDDVRLKKIATNEIKKFACNFSPISFRFPVFIAGLTEELYLNDCLWLIPAENEKSIELELELYHATRPFEFNYYIQVTIKSKCSNKFGYELARKIKNVTINSLTLLARRLEPNLVPIFAFSSGIHFFDFHLYSKDNKEFKENKQYNFSYTQNSENLDMFWNEIKKSVIGKRDDLIYITLNILNHVFNPSNEIRVVDKLVHSLYWYGQALSEKEHHAMLKNLVISMESLVNFNDEDKNTENFIKRITNLHVVNNQRNESIKFKATKIYKKRSEIVHGSSIDVSFDFCIIQFSTETLLRAIFLFSNYGLSEKGFKKKLPNIIDNLITN